MWPTSERETVIRGNVSNYFMRSSRQAVELTSGSWWINSLMFLVNSNAFKNQQFKQALKNCRLISQTMCLNCTFISKISNELSQISDLWFEHNFTGLLFWYKLSYPLCHKSTWKSINAKKWMFLLFKVDLHMAAADAGVIYFGEIDWRWTCLVKYLLCCMTPF